MACQCYSGEEAGWRGCQGPLRGCWRVGLEQAVRTRMCALADAHAAQERLCPHARDI